MPFNSLMVSSAKEYRLLSIRYAFGTFKSGDVADVVVVEVGGFGVDLLECVDGPVDAFGVKCTSIGSGLFNRNSEKYMRFFTILRRGTNKVKYIYRELLAGKSKNCVD